MKLRFGKLAVTTALVAAMLGACSPVDPSKMTVKEQKAAERAEDNKNAEWLRGEFKKLETSGTPMGDLFLAIREGQPELHTEFMDVVTREIGNGKSPFEAGAAARPIYMARFMELLKTTGDDDINTMLAQSIAQMETSLAMDPLLCVKLVRGEADPRMSDFPAEMRESELRLMARVLRAGKLDAPVASAEDVQAWAGRFVGAHPELGAGLAIFEMPAPSSEQAAEICRANIGVMKGLEAEAPAERARLFRGTLAQG